MKNKLVIGVGLAIAAILAYLKFVKPSETRSSSSGGGGSSYTTYRDGLTDKEYYVGNVTFRNPTERGNLIVGIAAPRPPIGTFSGKTVRITNMGVYSGVYPIIYTWPDSDGNAGAIYVDYNKYEPGRRADIQSSDYVRKAKITIL